MLPFFDTNVFKDTDAIKRNALYYVHRFIPVTVWYRRLTPRMALDDILGGLIVGVMLVPTCLSWSSLAGLPLSCGMVAALIASFSYGTFGQCAALSIGPVAEITTLLISIPHINAADREKVFQSLGVQVGLLSMLLSFIDCGTVIKTLFAKEVGDGYTCAAALLAMTAQLKVIFNVAPEDKGYGTFLNTMIALAQQWSSNCIKSALLFLVYCTYLIYVKKTKLPLWIPHQLIVLVVAILLTWGFRLDERWGLAIVRDISSSLSWPSFPPMNDIIDLGPYTLTIAVIGFVQMYVVAQRIMPDIDPDAELFAAGITNFLANIFAGMPVSNSFSCSAVLRGQGVHTPLTSYAAGFVVLFAMLFLTRLGVFYYLPKNALAAIIVASMWRLVNFSGPMQLWRYSRKDAAVWMLTFSFTVIGGITIGVLCGIAFSLVLVVLRIARPRAVSVGFNMRTFRYGDIRKDPELLVYPNILMWRFDAPLFFVNIGYFQERLQSAIAAEVRPIDVVLVTCGKVVDIDAAALAALPIAIDSIAHADPANPLRIILTDIHGRLEKVLLDSAALPIYVPEEYERLTIAYIEASGKFPVVFKRLEDAIAFAQRCISERYGNVDTAPYPNVSFLADVVVEAARMPVAEGGATSLFALINENAAATSPDPSGTALFSPTREGLSRGGAAEQAHPHTGAFAGGEGHGDFVAEPSPANTNTSVLITPQSSWLDRLAMLKKLSTFSPDRELIGVIGVIRHGEVTPKQKKKMMFSNAELLRMAFVGRDVRRTKRSVEELSGFFEAVENILNSAPQSIYAAYLDNNDESTPYTRPQREYLLKESWSRVLAIIRSHPDGLKVQLKPCFAASSGMASFAGSCDTLPQHPILGSGSPSGSGTDDDIIGGLLIVKWGGVLTKSGVAKAHVLGEKLFARFYAAGDLPLSRLMLFTQRPVVTSSDENRVIHTALVVANALTQSSASSVHRSDIILNDDLAKKLGPVARRLLHEEQRYFEDLLHITSAAAARHFFHIPGFRQLLWIPPLERPLANLSMDDIYGSDDPSDSESAGAGNAFAGNTALNFMRRGVQDISFVHGSRALPAADQRNYNLLRYNDFYTPYQVLKELEQLMRIIANSSFPPAVAKVPLSNHETLEELQMRYEALLHNFLGAKRRIRMTRQRSVQHPVEHPALGGAGCTTGEQQRNSKETPLDAASSALEGNSPGEQDCDIQFASSDDPDSDVVTEGYRRDPDEFGDDADQGFHAEQPSSTSTPGSGPLQHANTAVPGSLDGTASSPMSGSRKQLTAPTFFATLSAAAHYVAMEPDEAQHSHRHRSSNARHPKSTRYDVSDVSKLRDYGSYDLAYNVALLHDVHASLEDRQAAAALRRFVAALQRFADVTESLSRIGENVLEGVNSSKRFIIGSLVCNALLHKLYMDFRDFASIDERRGVQELLFRAQARYMAENGGVEQDVRHFLDFFTKCQRWRSHSDDAAPAPTAWGGETARERAFRLKFPFISLPKDEDLPEPRRAGNHRDSQPSSPAYSRLYFTSYLHVEGVLQCFFESATVDGFTRPSKEEMEVTHQLYMRHLILKVFRRRNVSFTDAEAIEALRKLKLLFRSDVEYDRQQRELRSELARIYHAMYYVSMEVFLSLGDADDTGGGDGGDPQQTREFALFTLNEKDEPTPNASLPGGAADGSGSATVARTSTPMAASQSSPNSVLETGADGRDEADTVLPMYARSPLFVPGEASRSRPRKADSVVVLPCDAHSLEVTSVAVGVSPGTDEAHVDGSDAGSPITVVPGGAPPLPRPKRHTRPAAATDAKDPVKEATVLLTPQAGRGTATVQEMKHRVCNVTPMRRIHEGLSLNDFILLMKEVESAVESQRTE